MESRLAGKLQSSAAFSLMEMLVVVAVLTVLMAGTAAILDPQVKTIDLRRADNAAREIYMAAQNQATKLNSNGSLMKLLSEPSRATAVTDPSNPTETQYYFVQGKAIPGAGDAGGAGGAGASATSSAGELLLYNSVNPDVWKGHFYIMYDPASASVTDVFYSTKPIITSTGSADPKAVAAEAMANAYNNGYRLKAGLGHYGAQAAELAAPQKQIKAIPAPVVTVNNGEELSVTVEYDEPIAAGQQFELTGEVQVDLWLEQGLPTPPRFDVLDDPINFGWRDGVNLPHDRIRAHYDLPVLGSSGVDKSTTIVDSKTQHVKVTFQKFDELMKAKYPGLTLQNLFGSSGNFLLRAKLSSPTSSDLLDSYGWATGNAIFQKVLSGTAYFSNMRHLQNLDGYAVGHSNYWVTKFMQTADIDCGGNRAAPKLFKPIVMNQVYGIMNEFNGDGYGIYNLRVKREPTQGASGLFGVFVGRFISDETADQKRTRFSNILLENFVVDPDGSNAGFYSGGLIGLCFYSAHIENVTVNKASICVSNYQAKKFPTSVGGLIGSVSEGNAHQVNWTPAFPAKFTKVIIRNCKVTNANLYKPPTWNNSYEYTDRYAVYAGGLVGNARGDVIVEGSSVYWTPQLSSNKNANDAVLAMASKLRDDSGNYIASIEGSQAGGLFGTVGLVSDEVNYHPRTTITNSFAATTLYGDISSGGIAGNLTGDVELTNSYVDCFIDGSSSAQLVGLIGSSNNTYVDNDQTRPCYPRLIFNNGYIGGCLRVRGGASAVVPEMVAAGPVIPSVKNVYSTLTQTTDGNTVSNIVLPSSKSIGVIYLNPQKCAQDSLARTVGTSSAVNYLESFLEATEGSLGTYAVGLGKLMNKGNGGIFGSATNQLNSNYFSFKVAAGTFESEQSLQDARKNWYNVYYLPSGAQGPSKYLLPGLAELPHYGGNWLPLQAGLSLGTMPTFYNGSTGYLNLGLLLGTDTNGTWKCEFVDSSGNALPSGSDELNKVKAYFNTTGATADAPFVFGFSPGGEGNPPKGTPVMSMSTVDNPFPNDATNSLPLSIKVSYSGTNPADLGGEAYSFSQQFDFTINRKIG